MPLLPLRYWQLLRTIAPVNACFVANIKSLSLRPKVSVKCGPADFSRVFQVPIGSCRSNFLLMAWKKKKRKKSAY